MITYVAFARVFGVVPARKNNEWIRGSAGFWLLPGDWVVDRETQFRYNKATVYAPTGSCPPQGIVLATDPCGVYVLWHDR